MSERDGGWITDAAFKRVKDEVRAAALEEAAKVADMYATVINMDDDPYVRGRQYCADDIADSIRALAKGETVP